MTSKNLQLLKQFSKRYICIWASLVAQIVKNPPEMQETWARSRGREAPLEEGTATHSSILGWRIPMDRVAWWATDLRVARVGYNRAHTHTLIHTHTHTLSWRVL